MIQGDRANTPLMAILVVEFSREGYKIRKSLVQVAERSRAAIV